MHDDQITFRSITTAMEGERVLRAAGIACTLKRTPQALRQNGCGYSLRLAAKDTPAAMEQLRRQGVPFRRAYRHLPDGRWEEATP